MFKRSNEETVQETQGPPAISQTTDAERSIVLSFPGRPEVRRDAMFPQPAASRGLAQMFGLDIRAAILTVFVDLMIFGGDAISLGILIPLGVVVAAVLAFIVYRIQLKWYKDDHDSALIKAMIIGLLTAIPAPLSPIIAIPGGIVGLVNAVRRK